MIVHMLAACIAAGIAVEVAPDQPIPHVFADEPMVLEFRADEPLTATATVSLAREGGEPSEFILGPMRLRPGSAEWVQLEAPQLLLGEYNVEVTTSVAGTAFSHQASVSVIERPDPASAAPAVAELTTGNLNAVLAAAGIPVRMARVATENADFEALMRACTRAGLVASVVVSASAEPVSGAGEAEASPDAQPPQFEARAEALARAFGSDVGQWELAGGNADALMRMVTAIRRGGSRAPVLAVVESADAARELLQHGAGSFITGLAVALDAPDTDSLIAVRSAAEEQGYERLPIHYVGSMAGTEDNAVGAVHALLRTCALTSNDPLIPETLVYRDGNLQPEYMYLSGMAHRLGRASYVGPLDTGKNGAEVLVFRTGSTWIAAVWPDSSESLDLTIGDADNIRLTDGCNNPLPADAADGKISLQLDRMPLYLSGTGGTVLARAARATAAVEARALLALMKGEQHPLAPYEATVTAIAKGDTDALDRLQFVGLLQGFPDIEKQWHSGAIARAEAVPAAAALARLVRVLCILEQEEGDEFVESLQNIIASSGEYQSVYLMGTGANGSEHERGDWLLEEVNRLVHEAELLRDAGRPIEAVGVASLAEARARALEFAAEAKPLSRPDDENQNKSAEDDAAVKT